MSEFEKRYAQLNENQRRAVDLVDGPVMVVAGPGTGKTELLGMRTANILQSTDVTPGNILCLTFTDSAKANMRERLAGLLGPDAYKVAVHTFHSFGSEVINTYGNYFYSGANFRPADELSSYEILSELLEKLPHDNPLSSTLNGQFTYLRDIQTTISELKRGGITPDELHEILERNRAFIKWVKPKLTTAFSERISKKTIPLAEKLLEDISSYNDEPLAISSYHSLASVIQATLQDALDEAASLGKQTPLTAWKNTYLEKDAFNDFTLKDEKRGEKLQSLTGVYFDYLTAMQEHELYDYDDMILRVVHALETFDDLRFSLQEQYQYILVDEFQDTNDAQMRLIWNLTNNPIMEGRPNLMVVGDDDQAIYRFQGAELSNVLDFTKRYRDVAVVTLTDNYRSNNQVLALARNVITQAHDRLETSLEGISKALTPHHTSVNPEIAGNLHESIVQSHAALAQAIAHRTVNQSNTSTAVIARNHKELAALVPQLEAAGVTFRYERQENVLESEPVMLLEETAHVLWHITRQEFDEANEHLAKVLAHPSWGLAPRDIWELSLEAHREKKYWLELMLNRDAMKDIAEWFIVGSSLSQTEPLEYMLDYIFGIGAESDEFSSPYKQYFFGNVSDISINYLSYLAALQTIRARIREYQPGQTLKLDSFIEYLNLYHDLELRLSTTTTIDEIDHPVTLLTAHKAKGLEFDTVFMTDVNESVWGSSARTRSRLLSFPANLPLSPAGTTDDERLRLLYVAMTRARDNLFLYAAHTNDTGKELFPVGALDGQFDFTVHDSFAAPDAAKALEANWYARLTDVTKPTQKAVLSPLLEHYKLSATHLNNYLDLTKGGPEYFLLHNLLRIPEAMPPSALYGSAIHTALQRAHQHLTAKKHRKPVEDILHDFEVALRDAPLNDSDFKKYLDRGVKSLTRFLDQRHTSFTENQQVERDFSGDHVVIGDAVITGKLDLIDIDHDEKTIFVTDYKTGKAVNSWKGKTEYEKIKMHHYEQQLMFYKLLIENSGQFTGYTVTGGRIEFVEPDERGEIVLLDYAYYTEKLAEFSKLVGAVWQHIQALDFVTPVDIDPSFKGIITFEKNLVC